MGLPPPRLDGNIRRLYFTNRLLADCRERIQLESAEFFLMGNVADSVSGRRQPFTGDIFKAVNQRQTDIQAYFLFECNLPSGLSWFVGIYAVGILLAGGFGLTTCVFLGGVRIRTKTQSVLFSIDPVNESPKFGIVGFDQQ